MNPNEAIHGYTTTLPIAVGVLPGCARAFHVLVPGALTIKHPDGTETSFATGELVAGTVYNYIFTEITAAVCTGKVCF